MNYKKEHYERIRQYEIMQYTPTDDKSKKAFKHIPYEHMKGGTK